VYKLMFCTFIMVNAMQKYVQQTDKQNAWGA